MKVVVKAYAKINLFLDVTGRRQDGYHEVNTLMRSISLCDDIHLEARPSDKTTITIICNDSFLDTGESNLIYKAALKYLLKFKIFADIKVHLVKRIPIGAGLGGGSSDAAATLRAMNKIFALATKEQLLEIAAELGSDVPFCIDGGSAFCSGRGEIIRPEKITMPSYVVVSIGKDRVSTPTAYAMLDERYGDFARYNEEKNIPDGEWIYYNIFEFVIKLDEIRDARRILMENGASHALMSGSGPAVFGCFDSFFDASSAKAALKKNGLLAFKCRII